VLDEVEILFPTLAEETPPQRRLIQPDFAELVATR